MKKIILGILLSTIFVSSALAFEVKIVPIDWVNGKTVTENTAAPVLDRRDIFNFLLELPNSNVRTSFQYIDLKFSDIKKGSKDYALLQKMVYLNYVENKKGNVQLDTQVNALAFYTFVEKSFWKNILSRKERTSNILKSRYANTLDRDKARVNLTDTPQGGSGTTLRDPVDGADIALKKAIFNDVYDTLVLGHYDFDKLDHKAMLDAAIEGLAKWTWDKHTVFFPPIKSKSFSDTLSGQFEGIGAYVDMKESGIIYIISPIPGSPAEKAGLKAWDVIEKVWDNTVSKDNSLQEVISWIKWPAGTKVDLVIKRGAEELTISVVREKIIVKEVEWEMKGGETYYVKMKTFGDSISDEFTKTMSIIKNNGSVNKIIFDLRNNPGGYLDQVNEILGNFVPAGKPVSIVKYRDNTEINDSNGTQLLNFWNYKIIVLQNGWTASASEIFIGTLKDYFPNTIIVWEKSYGKWSVQTVRGYNDGSLLKYTVAKWFTGKTSTGIDGIGIKPDVEIPFDDAQFKELGKDNQLDKALQL